MITIQGNKLLSKNLDDEFLLEIQKMELEFCQTHKTYHTGKCSFCCNNLETFYYQTNKQIQIINGVIIDLQDKPINNELYNAGISSYDQEINKQFIQEQLKQNIQPHEIAIQLQMYDEEKINNLISDELQNHNTNEQQEVQLEIDLWKISQTKTYLDRACDICQQLNLKNCYFVIPANKASFIQFESNDQTDCMATKEICDKLVERIKGEYMNIANKKVTLPYDQDIKVAEVKCKRILSKSIEFLQCQPFNGELIFLTNLRRDLLASAQKLGRQNSAVHIYCKSEDTDYYYNSGGAAGIKVNCLNADNIIEEWEYIVKVEATNNVIFLDSQTNNIEMKLQINQELSLEFELIDNEEAFVQIIILNKDGKCLVQQQKIEKQNEIYKPSVVQEQLSEYTLKLTEYSK